jgi:predicted DNA-binding transcriptional regulator YafY
VLALLELLQSSARIRTVADLAQRLDVDERTLRRYVAHLVELGVPVRSLRGRYGGITLAPGYRMPPLMLTDEEALAVLLGLVTARRAGVVATSPGVADAAVAKLRRVLPAAVVQRLDALLAAADAAAPTPPVSTPQADVLLVLEQAVRERRALSLTYAATDGRRSNRTVHPYGLVVASGHWYLSAADADRGELRTFRVDRVGSAQVLIDGFEVPPGFDAGAQVASALAQVPWRHEVSLRVRTTPEQAAGLFPPGLVTLEQVPVEQVPGEQQWVRVTLRAERLEWVPAVLAGLPVPFVIDSPQALRELVHSLARRLSAAADTPPGPSR